MGAAPRVEDAPASVFGTWKGTAALTNDSSPTTCRYEGGAESTVLKLQSSDAGPRAIVRLEVAGTPGSGCPPLQKRYEATNVVIAGSAVSFLDPAGQEWTLALREGRLVGLVAWKGGGKDEPLALGFAPPGGPPPLTRLSGEVALDRAAGEAAPGAASTEARPGRQQEEEPLPARLPGRQHRRLRRLLRDQEGDRRHGERRDRDVLPPLLRLRGRLRSLRVQHQHHLGGLLRPDHERRDLRGGLQRQDPPLPGHPVVQQRRLRRQARPLPLLNCPAPGPVLTSAH